jgi:hypothetical protein
MPPPVVPPVGVPPVSDARTFAMVAASAPDEVIIWMMASTWAVFKAAACAIGAAASIETAIVRPVATAATFVAIFVVIVITIIIF